MHAVPKVSKERSTAPRRRLWLIGAALLLIAVCAAYLLLNRAADEPGIIPAADTAVTLYSYDLSALSSVTIRRGEESAWTAVPTADGGMTLLGEDGFTLTAEESQAFGEAACHIEAEEVLTEDASVYADHLADFGLDDPRYEAEITYTDGTVVHLRVGDESYEGAWRYLLIDGDDRLFAFSNGSVESLFVNRDTLRTVTQPTLHKARIDRISLSDASGLQAEWALNGSITDADAADNWQITHPIQYPADSTAMANLLSNIANLRLGAYVCPATADALTAHGFDAPRLTIDIHMAAGTIATTNEEGAAVTADWPESTLTFVIGGEKSDMIDYVLCDGDIYLSSHFTMGLFIDYDVQATMSRYPVMTALGNLAALTIRQGDTADEYVLTRTEQVAENNDLVTDADGNTVYDITVTRNGEAIDYTAFEAAYNALTLVTVSGTLPADESVTAAPHTVYTFADVNGSVHTVELATFDALHDAVSVDGHQAFYLIKGGFKLDLQ